MAAVTRTRVLAGDWVSAPHEEPNGDTTRTDVWIAPVTRGERRGHVLLGVGRQIEMPTGWHREMFAWHVLAPDDVPALARWLLSLCPNELAPTVDDSVDDSVDK